MLYIDMLSMLNYNIRQYTKERIEHMHTAQGKAADVELGKVFKFGWREVPNKVVRIGAAYPDGSIPVTLRGPRGGESQATVFPSGKCRKH